MAKDGKIHIASLVYGRYPSDSRVRRQAEVLAAHGYEVDVIALRTDRDCSSYRLKGVNIHQLPLEKKRGSHLRYIFQYFSFFVLGFCWLTCLYIRNRYAVVHVNNMPNIIVYCALIPRLCGARVILDIHDPFPELYAVGHYMEGEHGFGYRMLCLEERLSAAFADHVICTTDLIRDVVVQRGAKRSRTSVVTNAPDPKIFSRPDKRRPLPSEKGTFTILYAGTVVERYGVSNVLRALNTVKADIPGLVFRVIGIGDGIEKLRETAVEIGADDILDVQPLKPVDEIPLEYEKADALLWFPQRNEFIDVILCVKVMEALAMGVPVISTRSSSHAYYFSGGEITFVDTLDPEELGEAALELYRNYELYMPLPAETKEFVEGFGWQNEQVKYLSVIDKLLPCAEQRKEVRSVEYG